jgi:rhamnogalacturonan endolyase
VHSQGLCSDIDARHPGAESYSADTDEEKKPAWARLWTATGQVLSAELEWSFGPTAVYWDADPQREVLWKGRLSSHNSGEPHEPRIEGKVVAVADIAGDWREEILTSVNGELRIYSTPIPAAERRPCLMQDPLYRNEVAVASMGYFQVPLLSYDMASR